MPRNRLAAETSPYLLQHADNPVDWYAWGPEALAAARAQDKPILLSVGYSACHWCHVMAHECFENEAIAGLMNERFISIKVDREERPDIDHIHQLVCQMLTRQGGWPLTVFLTPDGQPFYAGTYFPPDDRYGRPGFPRVLEALSEAWRTQRGKIVEQGRELVAAIARVQAPDDAAELREEWVARAARVLASQFDARHGGFGEAPKFPNPLNLELLLRSRDEGAARMVLAACRAMRAGGIYDQIGGGFHRYSVDAAWVVPHFEKMLYDNALLPRVYLAAWQATGEPDLAETVRDTLDYLLRDLRHPDGGFYAATDADSDGREGAFYVWTPDLVRDALDRPLADLACRRYGIETPGNFEHGTTVPHLAAEVDTLAAERGTTRAAVARDLERARATLLAARSRRQPPLRDEKVLCGQNGLAIIAFARAGLLLGEPRYVAAARDAAAFVLDRLWRDGRLLRVWCAGRAGQPAFLEDHAGLALALIELFCATGEPRWLAPAEALMRQVRERFLDGGRLYMTPADGERLVVRPADQHDNVTPSGTTLAALALVRLWHLTGIAGYRDTAATVLQHHASELRDNVWGSAGLLAALDEFLAEPRAVIVAGDGPRAESLVAAAAAVYDPNRLLGRRPPGPAEDDLPELWRGKAAPSEGAVAYVCEGFACRAPIRSVAELSAYLAE